MATNNATHAYCKMENGYHKKLKEKFMIMVKNAMPDTFSTKNENLSIKIQKISTRIYNVKISI